VDGSSNNPASELQRAVLVFPCVCPTIDYRCADEIKVAKLRGKLCPIKIGIDFLFQNNPIITAEKLKVKPKNPFEDNAFRALFEIVKS
jgi:hypothetical protein